MTTSQPTYIKTASILISVAITLWLLYVGQNIFKPLVFACLLAILLIAPSKFFERAGFPRGIAALISLILAFVGFFVIFYFISTSIISFKQDLPALITKVNDTLSHLQHWAAEKFKVSNERVQELITSFSNETVASTSYIVNTTVITVSTVIFITILIFIYTFLLLLYRSLIVAFFIRVFKNNHTERVYRILDQVRYVIKGYITGLLIEMLVVAGLNFLAFFFLGVKYAFMLAVISAIFNIIPYLGIFMACVLSTLITFTTDSLSTVIGVIVSLIIIHMIDSNILMPKIVGSKVKMNALATIIGVITVSSIWGIPGTFLAIPMLAVLKVIFDEIESMQPISMIMGDDTSAHPTSGTLIKNMFDKAKSKRPVKK